ncbi:MAG TPA: hypothetical protein VLS49_03775 [Usitatibacter sp.]|nr:hypothetical protein [Usitatibacter sp.]
MSAAGLHRCAGPSCPGLSYRASDLAHPASCAAPAPLNLDAIEARANAATPGPWRIERDELDESFSDEEQEQAFPRSIGPIATWDHVLLGVKGEEVRQIEADAAFVAAAREDVPALVAEVRRLRILARKGWEAAKEAGWSATAADEVIAEIGGAS